MKPHLVTAVFAAVLCPLGALAQETPDAGQGPQVKPPQAQGTLDAGSGAVAPDTSGAGPAVTKPETSGNLGAQSGAVAPKGAESPTGLPKGGYQSGGLTAGNPSVIALPELVIIGQPPPVIELPELVIIGQAPPVIELPELVIVGEDRKEERKVAGARTLRPPQKPFTEKTKQPEPALAEPAPSEPGSTPTVCAGDFAMHGGQPTARGQFVVRPVNAPVIGSARVTTEDCGKTLTMSADGGSVKLKRVRDEEPIYQGQMNLGDGAARIVGFECTPEGDLNGYVAASDGSAQAVRPLWLKYRQGKEKAASGC